jgi:two-component system cell cycle sensor histidine kinase/response regulator CckA
MPTESFKPRELLHQSATELLQLAISACDACSGAVRLGESTIASGPALPLDIAESLALRTLSENAPLVIFHENDLQGSAPLRFYAAVKVVDGAGALRGTLAIGDDHARTLTERQRESLMRIAAQLTRDVELTDLVRALAEEQAQLRPLVEAAPVAVFQYGISSGRLSYVNSIFAETLGYTAGEILKLDSVFDIIAEEQRDRLKEMIRRREAGDDRKVRYVTKVRCRDGRLLDAEIHGSVADLEEGRIVIGAAVDVTRQMAANQLLREREEYFRTLTDQLSDIIAIVSRDRVLTYASPSIQRVLGHEPEELIGTTTWVTVHPDDRERFSVALRDLAGGSVFAPAEYRFQHKAGTWRTLEVVATNLLEHPQIHGLVLNLHDITDRKRMEQELGQLHRLTSLGRLAAQVAHEFNNVMMGIQPIAELIRRRATNDPALMRLTDVISASLRRGKRVTTDILRFGKPAQLALRLVNVQDLIRQVADEMRPMLGEEIRLNLLLPSTAMHVVADPAQLAQVLVNLALNARDAMEMSGGVLTLEARPGHERDNANADAYIHITIADTGAGIAANDLPYIFEPLYTTKQRGTGLGLSVVYQVVATHGGRVSVESEPGKGTTFHLLIPSAPASAYDNDPAPALEIVKPRRSLRVLVVEDEELIASGLRWFLEAEGNEVHVVGKGADVLPAIATFRPDVMVLDLSLPDEDGRTVYERVLATTPLPVVFSSGHASEAEIDKLVEGSRAAFLMKPYAVEDLLTAIQRVTQR